MPELWDQLQQQPVAEPPSLWPQGDRAPLRITVGGPTMKDGSQVSGSSLDPFNPPQVEYVGTPLANTLWSALKEMGVKGQRLLSGLQQYSGEQFPAGTGTQTMSTDTEPVKQAVENMDPMLANLWGIGSASVPRGAVGAIGSRNRMVENAAAYKQRALEARNEGTGSTVRAYDSQQALDRARGGAPDEGSYDRAAQTARAGWDAAKSDAQDAFLRAVYPERYAATAPATETTSQLFNRYRSGDDFMLGAGTVDKKTGAAMLATANDPIRAYHRSPKDFEKFDLSFTGTTTDPGKLGTAHYFSTDANVAKDGPHRYEANIALNNPIELQYPKWGTDKQKLITDYLGLPADAHAQDIRMAAIKRGHDGAVLDYSPVGYKHKEIAAYRDELVNILRKYGLAGTAGGALAPGLFDQEQRQ
jgi:hypothetical protein